MGDNGEIKTPEELKKQAFEANPDDFININELIIAVKKKGNLLETLIGSVSRTELEIALMRITHQCFGVFNAMSHAQQQANAPKIVKPGIMNFVRNKKR